MRMSTFEFGNVYTKIQSVQLNEFSDTGSIHRFVFVLKFLREKTSPHIKSLDLFT